MSVSPTTSDPLVSLSVTSAGEAAKPEPALKGVAGKALPASKADASPTSLAAESSYGPDDMTCAICLEQIQLENTAYVVGCEHAYCAKCILQWAELRESCSCPQCKKPFSRLLTYRTLDGTMSDFPVEESVCLLKRATWVQDEMKTAVKGKAVAASDSYHAAQAYDQDPVTDWQDYSNFYDEYDDDEEVEDFYFSSAAGRARIVLGNRRWGENGYVASGRQQGRPVHRNGNKGGQGSSSSGKKGSSGKASAGNSKQAGTPGPKTPSGRIPETPPSGAAAASSDLMPTPVSASAEAPHSAQQDLNQHKHKAGPSVVPRDGQVQSGQQSEISAVPIAVGNVRRAQVGTPATPSTPIAIAGRKSTGTDRRSSGSDIAGTSSDGAWGSANSGSGWASYRQGKKKSGGGDSGLMGRSPSSDANASSSKAGRRARRNAKKAAADAKANVYAY